MVRTARIDLERSSIPTARAVHDDRTKAWRTVLATGLRTSHCHQPLSVAGWAQCAPFRRAPLFPAHRSRRANPNRWQPTSRRRCRRNVRCCCFRRRRGAMEAEAPKPTTLLGCIREHKLRCVGGVWAGGISGALTYNMLFKPGACGAWRESKGGRRALCSVIVSCLLRHVRPRCALTLWHTSSPNTRPPYQPEAHPHARVRAGPHAGGALCRSSHRGRRQSGSQGRRGQGALRLCDAGRP